MSDKNIKNKFKNFSSFLGLMKKYKSSTKQTNLLNEHIVKKFQLNNIVFIKLHIPLLSIFYIFEFTNFWNCVNVCKDNTTLLKNLYYYANFNKKNKYKYSNKNWNFFYAFNVNNVLVFSKPAKQLFIVFFKKKPIFIFTGGLMRIVMNEKKKSSKKLYKVAISLIKLSAILLNKKNYFPSCYLIINNVGLLKAKILNTFGKAKVHTKIQYIIVKFSLDFSAQKFNTRRSIKKYVKKRFKIN